MNTSNQNQEQNSQIGASKKKARLFFIRTMKKRNARRKGEGQSIPRRRAVWLRASSLMQQHPQKQPTNQPNEYEQQRHHTNSCKKRKRKMKIFFTQKIQKKKKYFILFEKIITAEWILKF